MRTFTSPTQAQGFLTMHGLTQNLFRFGHHLMQAVNYRLLRTQGFQIWKEAVCHEQLGPADSIRPSQVKLTIPSTALPGVELADAQCRVLHGSRGEASRIMRSRNFTYQLFQKLGSTSVGAGWGIFSPQIHGIQFFLVFVRSAHMERRIVTVADTNA